MSALPLTADPIADQNGSSRPESYATTTRKPLTKISSLHTDKMI